MAEVGGSESKSVTLVIVLRTPDAIVDDVAVHAAKRAQEIVVLLRADLEERRALFHGWVDITEMTTRLAVRDRRGT